MDLSSLDHISLSYHSLLGSTNDEARNWGLSGAPDGSVVVADSQTSGRGRLDRTWHSPPGVNLHFSQIIRLNGPDLQRLIPLLGAVAARTAISQTIRSHGTTSEPSIKWPNDVLHQGLKLAGILAEWVPHPNPFAVLGVGINVNLDPAQLPQNLRRPATSLKAVVGCHVSRSELTRRLYRELEQNRALMVRSVPDLLEEYGAHCSTIGSRVRVNQPGETPWLGTASGIAPDGSLEVRTESGQLMRVEAGDVDPVQNATP